jgi:outer membrane protein assembly factor BamB
MLMAFHPDLKPEWDLTVARYFWSNYPEDLDPRIANALDKTLAQDTLQEPVELVGPAVGPDGNIYLGTPKMWVPSDGLDPDAMKSYLVAVNPDGTVKWHAKSDNAPVTASPIVSSDGTVVVATQREHYDRHTGGVLGQRTGRNCKRGNAA